MRVIITKLSDQGFEETEYKARAVKGTDTLLALDIEGVGWRAFEYDKDYCGFEIREV